LLLEATTDIKQYPIFQAYLGAVAERRLAVKLDHFECILRRVGRVRLSKKRAQGRAESTNVVAIDVLGAQKTPDCLDINFSYALAHQKHFREFIP
jgi:hypothetical protein